MIHLALLYIGFVLLLAVVFILTMAALGLIWGTSSALKRGVAHFLVSGFYEPLHSLSVDWQREDYPGLTMSVLWLVGNTFMIFGATYIIGTKIWLVVR